MSKSTLRERPIANVVLFCMTLMFLISYPQRHTDIGALIMHISGAAMIGGLADWYAVTALFKKPLGISYKTALLPRSKERLIQMARHMLTDEILRVPYMYRIIKRERVMSRIIHYVLSQSGQAQVKSVLHTISEQLVGHIDLAPLRDALSQALSKGVATWKITPLVIQFGRSLLDAHTMTILWYYFNRTCQRVIGSDEVYPYLYRIMQAILQRYSDGSLMSELGLAFGGDSMSPEFWAKFVQRKLVDLLQAHESINSPLGQYLCKQANRFLDNLAVNQEWQSVLENYKEKYLPLLVKRVSGQVLSDEALDWDTLIDLGIEKLNAFSVTILEDESKLEPFERFMLLRLVPILEWIRPIIDKMVYDELSSYTPQEMTDIVRSRMYYDLQIIRINGSLVGAVLGGLFFGAAQLVKVVFLQ